MLTPDQENVIYRDNMEGPMTALSVALWGFSGCPIIGSDAKIVQIAARKIELLKKMILSTGFDEKVLKAIMEDT